MASRETSASLSRPEVKAKGFLVELSCFVPLVLALMCLRQNVQGPEPVPRVCQQAAPGGNGLLVAAEQREDPHPFQRRALLQPILHGARVHKDIAQRGRIRAPYPGFAIH